MHPLLPQHPKKIRPRLTLTQEIHKGYRHLLISVIVLNIILLSLFIINNSSYSTYGYTLTKLQKHNTELLEEQKYLDRILTEARSMNTIEKEMEKTDMIPLKEAKEKVSYANPKSPFAGKERSKIAE